MYRTAPAPLCPDPAELIASSNFARLRVRV
jgi:hypothetical protein